MKISYAIMMLVMLTALESQAQWKSFQLSPRGDTLNRVDMKGRKQGPWVNHVDDLRGERGYEEQGYYENDEKEGVWKKFSLQGVKIAEENYRWGKLDGKSKYYTYNGGLERIESWRAMDPARKFDTVGVYDLKDPSKELQRIVIKNEGVSVKHGTWIFYDPVQGREEARENYVLGKIAAEDGTALGEEDALAPIDMRGKTAKTDSVGAKPKKPQAILDYEKKNSGKKKIKNRDGATGL
ncbi:hypothetical protein JMG10_06015 [Nostoc ellipsosporum NOK]|jgi:hypothetical protein|nr:hypothetical protein [Nostoc ellipsosporum NOK]